MVEITEVMSMRPPIPSQDASKFVRRRASAVASLPPPPPPSSQPEVRESMKRKRTSWVWGHFKKSVDEAVEDFDKSEVERYLSEQIYSSTKDKKEGSNFDILTWWKNNAARFDILSLIARDILVIPVSSVASESAFSTGKRILGHFGSSLRPRTVEALILLQNWLRTPIDMDPSTLEAEEKEDDVLESDLFGDLSVYSVIVDDD
ncbi:hypothetical protein C5167_049569 [Papaver somniferum]|uniref:HAT C-terminal dimerisation domain-containing protein n=1 Tax=Papaver somniferum TaxID=3469 RepID=A0A4Y7KPK2_PAPSO|nr:hypothetical protein C5167_049569 [Papaver somniferum]